MLGVDVEKAQAGQPIDRDLGLGRGGFGFKNSSKAEGCSSSKPHSPPWSRPVCRPNKKQKGVGRSAASLSAAMHAPVLVLSKLLWLSW